MSIDRTSLRHAIARVILGDGENISEPAYILLPDGTVRLGSRLALDSDCVAYIPAPEWSCYVGPDDASTYTESMAIAQADDWVDEAMRELEEEASRDEDS